MTIPDYISIDPYKDQDVHICNACSHLQYEPKKSGKFAWRCDKCRAINEGNKVHLLQNTANFGPRDWR